jgi:hypothetical protein
MKHHPAIQLADAVTDYFQTDRNLNKFSSPSNRERESLLLGPQILEILYAGN